MRSLTRDVILRALNLLAGQLPPGRPPVDLIVVGGAAMVLLFAARESTKDVDAFSVEPGAQGAVSEAARWVAAALELPDDWLNDAAKGYAHGKAREDVWRQVERHLVPGRELKARYAFDDLWESQHGTA